MADYWLNFRTFKLSLPETAHPEWEALLQAHGYLLKVDLHAAEQLDRRFYDSAVLCKDAIDYPGQEAHPAVRVYLKQIAEAAEAGIPRIIERRGGETKIDLLAPDGELVVRCVVTQEDARCVTVFRTEKPL